MLMNLVRCKKCRDLVSQDNIAVGHITLCVECKRKQLDKKAQAARDRYWANAEHREQKKKQSREYQRQRYSSDASYREQQNAKSREHTTMRLSNRQLWALHHARYGVTKWEVNRNGNTRLTYHSLIRRGLLAWDFCGQLSTTASGIEELRRRNPDLFTS